MSWKAQLIGFVAVAFLANAAVSGAVEPRPIPGKMKKLSEIHTVEEYEEERSKSIMRGYLIAFFMATLFFWLPLCLFFVKGCEGADMKEKEEELVE